MGNIQKLNWEQARNTLFRINPELCLHIDRLCIDESYGLYEVEYEYGQDIVKDGKLMLPIENGSLAPLDSHYFSKELQEDISYNYFTNPVFMLLSNTMELFFNLPGRRAPYAIMKPGNIAGLWKVLDGDNLSYCPNSKLWGVSAGSKTMFMLPKISEKRSHDKLCKNFGFSIDAPIDSLGHTHVFQELCKSNSSCNWTCKVLLFGRKWFVHKGDPAWLEFNQYLFRTAWKGSDYWRNQFMWNLALNTLQVKLGIKPKQYVVDIVKHLFAIIVGAIPGYSVCTNDSIGPVSFIQMIYQEVYNIKSAPLILGPEYFTMFDSTSPHSYFSLQRNSALELSPKSSDKLTSISYLYEIASLLNRYIKEVSEDGLGIVSEHLLKLSEVKTDFFHSAESDFRLIQSSDRIFEEDPNLLSEMKKFDTLKKPNSPFLNGLIRISHAS